MRLSERQLKDVAEEEELVHFFLRIVMSAQRYLSGGGLNK